MTIVYSATRASDLSTAGTENNPAVFWENLATAANVSSLTGSVSGFPPASAVTGTTYDAFVPLVPATSAALEVDLGSATSVSCGAISAHNLSSLGAITRIQYSDDSISWFDSGAGPVSPSDDQAIVWRFHAQSHRYWRLEISSIPMSSAPEVSIFVLGDETIIGQRIYQGYTPPITPNVVELQSNVSDGGNLLGSTLVRKGSRTSAGLTHITPAFLRGTTWADFQTHFNGGGGFFWLWRPTKYGDAFYAWRDGGAISPTNSGPKDYMSFDMGMRFYDQP